MSDEGKKEGKESKGKESKGKESKGKESKGTRGTGMLCEHCGREIVNWGDVTTVSRYGCSHTVHVSCRLDFLESQGT